jgi:hypothetical protein
VKSGRVGIPLDRLLIVSQGRRGVVSGECVSAFLRLAARLVGVEIEDVPQLAAGDRVRIERASERPGGPEPDGAHGIVEQRGEGAGCLALGVGDKGFEGGGG